MSHPVYTSVFAGDVLPIYFTTYAGSTGASVTLSGLAVTDIEIYKDASMTQRASDAGYTLIDTDGIDVDGVTGLHGFTIDTGDNTDASFYTTGAWFTVVVSTVTVDSQTVTFIAAQFRIVPAETVAGTPKVDAAAISGDATAADNLETAFDDTAGPVPWMGIIDQGTAQSATSTTLVLRSAATFADDTAIGATIMVYGSTQGYWQQRAITDYVLSTDTATVDAWTVTPSGTITYKIFATAPAAAGGTNPTAAEIADAVWDEDATAHQTGGTFGQAIGDPASDTTTMYAAVVTGAAGTHVAADIIAMKADTAAILVDTGTTLDGRIPAALVSGRMDSSVGAMAANVMTAAAAASDLTTELQSGLATAAALATVDGIVDDILVDTAVIGAAGAGLTALATAAALTTVEGKIDTLDTVADAVKAKTDSLTFTVASVVDANIQRINDVTITGDGSSPKFGV